MSFFEKLTHTINNNQSLLCVGLDPNPAQIPSRYAASDGSADVDALFAWNRAIIESTAEYAAVYKPNIAFYEALGTTGQDLLRRTLAAIPDHIPVLLDAKRGDIGSTAAAYAQACFDDLNVDAVTLNPYLGRDSIDPFAAYEGKGLFVLCHTSNPSAGAFQKMEISDWRQLDRESNWPLYLHVAHEAVQWSPNVGLVVGATYPAAVADVRKVAPDAWFLIPGIGAQGGDLEATLAASLRRDQQGALISVSRGISLADDHGVAAETFRQQINQARESAAA